MKILKLIPTSLLVTFLIGVAVILACKSNEPTPKERSLKLLTSGTWSIKTVSMDGLDRTSMFPNLTLTFNNQTYTSGNGGAIWVRQDTWSFRDDAAKIISIGDGKEITIDSLSNNKLIIRLKWNKATLRSGKTPPPENSFIFRFSK